MPKIQESFLHLESKRIFLKFLLEKKFQKLSSFYHICIPQRWYTIPHMWYSMLHMWYTIPHLWYTKNQNKVI